MKITLLKYIFFILLVMLIVSCGLNYEKNSKKVKNALTYNKNYTFNLQESKSDYLLLNQEAGLFSFLKNDLDKSINYFNNAIHYYRQIEENSKINFKNALSFTVLSDTLINYEGSDYESSLVHYYTGLVYLLKSDLQKAYIEFKAAEESQKFSEQLRQKKIIASENKINSFLSQYNLQSQEIDKMLEKSNEIRANTRNNFLNANILYLAGIVRELNKSYNDALINYKQAYAIQPHNTYLLEDLYRLSLIYDRDFANSLSKNHKYLNNISFKNYYNSNTIYLIYEQGYIPQKENLKIPLIGIGENNLILSINLPVYNNTSIPNNNIKLILPKNNNLSVHAEDITNIYKLAKNHLAESYPVIISKQISKLITQITTQKILQTNNITNNFTLLSSCFYLLDSSDTRSWRILPSLVKTAKITTNSSIKQIVVTVNNTPYTLDLSLNNAEIAIVYMFDTGYHIYTKVLYKHKKE